MAVKKLIQCPECKFANRYGEPRCLMCKSELPTPPKGPGGPRSQGGPKPGAPPAGRRPRKPGGPARGPARTFAMRRGKGPAADAPPQRPPRPKTRRVQPRPSPENLKETLCWLCCDPLPPIPLGPRPQITVGRSDKCDLVLPHKEVSRVHGLIKVRFGSNLIVYEDEGSSNGSYLNGKRVPSTILKVGDTLTIGPYELDIRSNESMTQRHPEDASTTNSLELTSVARVKPSAAMTGLLQEVPMTEVLQGIEFNKKTGTLSVVGPNKVSGELVFGGGQPLFATFGELSDDEAVLEMIALREGRFTLSGETEPGERTMSTTLTGLLLEASRRIDEAGGLDEVRDEPLMISSDENELPTATEARPPLAEEDEDAGADAEEDEKGVDELFDDLERGDVA